MRFVTDTYEIDGRNGLCEQKYSRFKLHIKTSYFTIFEQWNCNDNDHGFAYVDDHMIYPVIQHKYDILRFNIWNKMHIYSLNDIMIVIRSRDDFVNNYIIW